MVTCVKAVLDLAHRPHGAVQVTIPGQDDERGIRSWALRYLECAVGVVLFWDPSYWSAPKPRQGGIPIMGERQDIVAADHNGEDDQDVSWCSFVHGLQG